MFPIDARPISRLDAAAAVAGAPAIYHLQALSQHFLQTRTRNTLSKEKKYTLKKKEIQKKGIFIFHLPSPNISYQHTPEKHYEKGRHNCFILQLDDEA